ncbi:uncharacterized protein LOC127135377 [Lathyrus oleraceus]|uniref:Uncharacterized protein n=1 Tax=Pisum sativum TaxID=3888 RepID=A0A9D5AU01_PEA|nr:uncharacterized protein LOC127135377 [Pisum sativum]KAI5418749.1 hypothetical protein KIW84_043102 [Pisum sativum]
MHRQAVKSNLVDLSSDRKMIGSRNYDHPICPKPIRLSPSIPDFLKPINCSKHSHQNIDERNGVLNMIIEKNVDGMESICNGCLPCCYSGSPPRRTENPLVHDVEFLHQMEVVSPLLSRTKFSDKFSIASASTM